MKKILTLFMAVAAFSISLTAQLSIVNFEEELRQLNNGEAIPAEKKLLVVGTIPSDISLVEVLIFTSKGKDNRKALYTNFWLRPEDNTGTQYKVPIQYRLNAGKEYDFSLRYFKMLNDEEKQQLYSQLVNNLNNYVDQSFAVGKKKLDFSKKTKHIIKDLNNVVVVGLSNYRTSNYATFSGFSDIIRGQLNKIQDANLKEADRVVDEKDAQKAKQLFQGKMIADLKQMIASEVQFVLNDKWNSLDQVHYVDHVETEKRNGYFSINAGYGAVYLGGNIDNLNYETAPYLGLAFPLSTSTIAPKIFRNASITVGVFLEDFEGEDDKKITGPIIKRPLYLGLDYKLFQFIRFNAGAAFLEEVGEDNGQVSGIEKRVFIKPFIGLSAKINLSIGLDK